MGLKKYAGIIITAGVGALCTAASGIMAAKEKEKDDNDRDERTRKIIREELDKK